MTKFRIGFPLANSEGKFYFVVVTPLAGDTCAERWYNQSELELVEPPPESGAMRVRQRTDKATLGYNQLSFVHYNDQYKAFPTPKSWIGTISDTLACTLAMVQKEPNSKAPIVLISVNCQFAADGSLRIVQPLRLSGATDDGSKAALLRKWQIALNGPDVVALVLHRDDVAVLMEEEDKETNALPTPSNVRALKDLSSTPKVPYLIQLGPSDLFELAKILGSEPAYLGLRSQPHQRIWPVSMMLGMVLLLLGYQYLPSSEEDRSATLDRLAAIVAAILPEGSLQDESDQQSGLPSSAPPAATPVLKATRLQTAGLEGPRSNTEGKSGSVASSQEAISPNSTAQTRSTHAGAPSAVTALPKPGWVPTTQWTEWQTKRVLTSVADDASEAGFVVRPSFARAEDSLYSDEQGFIMSGKLSVVTSKDDRMNSFRFCRSALQYEIRPAVGRGGTMDQVGGDHTKAVAYNEEEACSASVEKLVGLVSADVISYLSTKKK